MNNITAAACRVLFCPMPQQLHCSRPSPYVFDAYSITREFTARLSLRGRVNRAPVELLPLFRAARAVSLIHFLPRLSNEV